MGQACIQICAKIWPWDRHTMAMRISQRELRNRWSSQEGQRLVGVVKSWLQGNHSAELSELGVIEGRMDFRGVPLSGGMATMNALQIHDADFSLATLDGFRLVDCVLGNCVFDQSSCQDWRLWATTISGSSFVETDLRNASLGAWRDGRGNYYTNVDFTSARLQGVGSSAATYEDCDFSQAKLDGVNFWQSSLIRCKFPAR